MVLDIKKKDGKGQGQKGKGKWSTQKKKKKRKAAPADQEEPAPKKIKRDSAEFTYIRFKFLLRSPETVVTGLESFLDMCGEEEEEEEDEEEARRGLELLESYVKSSPQCSEVMDLLTPKASSQEISLVFTWLRMVLQKCPSVTKAFSELQQHLVKTLLSRHGHLIVNSLRRGNKIKSVKSTLMLLLTISSLGHKFSKLLHTYLNFTHANWSDSLSRRDRKEEVDVRACMVALLMRLLKTEDEELTRSLVDQRVLLQEVLLGLKYDRSEYVIRALNTVHECIVMNGAIGKNPKMYLFNSPVLTELVALYRWPGPSQWKQQQKEDEKEEYTEEQQQVAKWVHPLLVDLLTNHKLGICFRDRSYGTAHENKNPAVSKVLQVLVTSYSTPLSHQLATAVLSACPDQVMSFLKLLHPHLSPRPVDTWIACLRFFLTIVENHEWPSELTDNADMLTEEKASQIVHFLFPPEAIISSLKDGLKSPCATVRDQCLQALETIARRGQHFHGISRSKLGDQAPLSLGIEGFVSKTLPNSQLLLNLLQKLPSEDSFAVPIARDLHKDDGVAIPHVSRFQHLVAILSMYSLAPEHLTGGPADTLPKLLQQVGQVVQSEEEVDRPPEGTPATLPSLCLLQALSRCDARKLNLFGKGGSKGDPKNSLVHQLVCLMQSQIADESCTQMALACIVKLLVGTGLFEGHAEELAVWLRHLQCVKSAPGEVVAFFVGLLRQYMSNPYPAIDRLLELVEQTPQMTDDLDSGIRQEFSPLAMFALDGEFHTSKKVHHYVCSVLIDLLHMLHKPCGFSRLVHSLSSDLDPEVTLYLTFHTAEEKMTPESMSKRMSKQLRMKHLKAFRHGGVTLMKKLLKGGEEEVGKVVEGLPASGYLPLVQLCLRYLDELVFGSVKTQGELLNRRLAEVCVEVVKSTCHCLAKAACTVKMEETTEETAQHTAELKLPQIETDHYKPVVTCILNHPLITHWLFDSGFKQEDTPREELVLQLCDVVLSMNVADLNMETELPFDVASKCQHMLQAVSELAETSQVPEKMQPLLCKCLEALISVGGSKAQLEALLTLVALPLDNFVSESSQKPSPLAETVCKMTDHELPDIKSLKEFSSRVDLEVSLKGLFDLVSSLDHAGLVSLALSCVQSVPELASACSVPAFQGMLRKVEKEGGGGVLLLQLLEALMAHSAQCRTACGQWLQKKKKSLKQGRELFHSIMLLYLRLFLTLEESAAGDAAVSAIAEVACHKLDSPGLAVDGLDPTFLHVVCYLINFDILDSSSVNKLQDHLLSALQEGAPLQESHVQLLAATVRHQSLQACDPQQEEEGGIPTKEKKWSRFEGQAGQVLLAGVRYLTGGGVGSEDVEDGRRCRCLLVHLCQDLLCLSLPSEVKTAIISFWPEIVTYCLKHHYKEADYIVLLRKLVQRLFTNEEHASKEVSAIDDGKTDIIMEDVAQESSDEEDGDSEEDEDSPKMDTPKPSSPNQKSETLPKHAATTHKPNKTLSTVVNENARRLGLIGKKSSMAKKLIALYDKARETTSTTCQSEIVSRWTNPAHRTFFLWPSESTSASSRTKTMTAFSADGGRIVDLCEKVVGHTSFLSVMQEEEDGKVRGEVVVLLALLVRLQTSCCAVLPLKVLVAAYGATLSITDQNLLYLMFACDVYGNQRFSPGLWGEKAVKQLEARREVGRSLLHETSLEKVLPMLDGEVMAASILHFPLLRTMEFHISECAEPADRMMSREDCYDPRFLLQLFFHLMGPEHVVNVQTFIAHKGLGFTLAALSSHDTLTRRLAIGILSNLHSHLDMARRWSATPTLSALLKVLINGMTKECQKVPCLVTLFLAKAADYVMSPENDMYVAVHSFLMLKPALDVNNVPEFFNFFNSPNPKERVWILRLLQDGMRETSDHRLCQRRSVYKLLMCHASSSLSDPQTRRESVKVLVQASSMASVVKDLVTKHGLLPWLLAFVKDFLPDTSEMTRLVCQLLHNVCYTCEFHRYRLWWLSLSRLSRCQLLYVPLLANVRLLLQSFSHLDADSLTMLENILQHPYITTASSSSS